MSKLWTPFGLFVLDPEWFFGVGFPLNKTVGSRESCQDWAPSNTTQGGFQRAEGEEIWLGGWALDSDEIKERRWFSERLDCRRFPWLKGGGEAYRQIAALELLATLVAVVVFGID